MPELDFKLRFGEGKSCVPNKLELYGHLSCHEIQVGFGGLEPPLALAARLAVRASFGAQRLCQKPSASFVLPVIRWTRLTLPLPDRWAMGSAAAATGLSGVVGGWD